MITEPPGADALIDAAASATANSLSQRPLVWAAVICYRGNQKAISRLCRDLSRQADRVLVLDNGGDTELRDIADQCIDVLPMPANLGTGGAMNLAWHKALAANVDFMVCFDQDSQVNDDLIEKLLAGWQTLQSQGVRIGAIGPAWRDPRTGRILRALKPTRWRRQRVDANTAASIEVDHLITSGCLIGAQTMREAGFFKAELFLDYVDIEWSLRARHCGFHFFVTREAQMRHEIGEQVVTVLGRSLWVHRPDRQYFLVRNHLLLWRLDHISLPWKIRDALQVALKIALLVLLQPPRLRRLAWAARGLWDGLRGRSGPIM